MHSNKNDDSTSSTEPGYYTYIPAEVRYDRELPANAKILYGDIKSICDQAGICTLQNEYFAKLYGTSNMTVSRWIRALTQSGYISSKTVYCSDPRELSYQIRELRVLPLSDEED